MENENKTYEEEVRENTKKKSKIILTVIAIIVAFFGGLTTGILTNSKSQTANNPSTADELLPEIIDVLNENWFYANSVDDIESSIISSGLSSLTESMSDPYTYYLTAEEYQAQVNNTNQNYVGIGVQINLMGEYPMITNVFKSSPAEIGGLEAGDYIIEIDGQDVKDKENDDLTSLVLGEEGTEVVITYKRGDSTKEVTLIRAQITHTTNYEVKDGVGYIEVTSFGNSTASEVSEALDYFENKEISKLIIDLRDNGGGYLDALIDFASLFLDEGQTIIQMKYRDDSIVPYYAENTKRTYFNDIVVLVNENSASASEVFAAALQENEKATVVGVQTYGKGTSQTVSFLSDGSVMQYTQTNWLTPKGNLLQDIGVTPDVVVPLNDYMYLDYKEVPENLSVEVDSVSEWVKLVQCGLELMGYDIDRKDGYFSNKTNEAITKYSKDYSANYQNIITAEFIQDFIVDASYYYYNNIDELDYQMQKSLDILK